MDKKSYLLSLVFLFIAGSVSIRSIETPINEWNIHNDFAHYYITAHFLRNGENPYGKDINARYPEFGFVNHPKIDLATNPPVLGALVIPFSYIAPDTAYFFWTAFQVTCLLGSISLIIRSLNMEGLFSEKALIAAASFVMYPVWAHLERGQVQILILFLISLGFLLLREGIDRGCKPRIYLGSFIWGLSASIKFSTIPLFYPLFFVKGAKTSGVFILGLLAPNILLALIFGTDLYQAYFASAVPYIQDTLTRFNGSNGFQGAVFYTARTLNFSEGADSRELLSFINFFSMGLLLFILVLDFLMVRGKREFAVLTSICILFSLLFSPTTWNHYLVLAIFPLLVLLNFSGAFSNTGKHFLHPIVVLIAYMLISLSQGILQNAELGWQLVSAWWGVVAMMYVVFWMYVIQKRVDPGLPHVF